MNTVINIVAAIVLMIIIIIAISGSRNLNRFHNNMDGIFDEAQKEAEEYAKRLKEVKNGNTHIERELSSNQRTNQTKRH